MTPDERLHPKILQAVQRYISYHWDNTLIQSLIRYRFNVKLTTKCLQTIRAGAECSKHCQSICSLK